MSLLVGLLIALSVAGAWHWLRAPRVPFAPLAVVALGAFAACVGILIIAQRPPPQVPIFQDIQPGAWPKAGLVGDLAYYGFWVALWLVSIGIGAGLATLSQGGGIKKVASLTIGLIAMPLLFAVWFLGTWSINCSYAFSQIGHACY